MGICAKQHWTLDQWRELPDREKDLWVHYYDERVRRINEFIEQGKKNKSLTPEVRAIILSTASLNW